MNSQTSCKQNIGTEFAFRYFKAFSCIRNKEDAMKALDERCAKVESKAKGFADMVARAKEALQDIVIPEAGDYDVIEWEITPEAIALVRNTYDISSMKDEELAALMAEFDPTVFPGDIETWEELLTVNL